MFDNGSTMQKRFIFSVVERRMPQSSEYKHQAPVGIASRILNMVMSDAPSSTQLVDHLSELFVSISDLCQEQFLVIRQVSHPG